MAKSSYGIWPRFAMRVRKRLTLFQKYCVKWIIITVCCISHFNKKVYSLAESPSPMYGGREQWFLCIELFPTPKSITQLYLYTVPVFFLELITLMFCWCALWLFIKIEKSIFPLHSMFWFNVFSQLLACVNCVRWSHSGKFMASGGDDKLVMIWQTSRGAGPSKAFGSSGSVVIHEQWRPVHTLRGHIGGGS